MEFIGFNPDWISMAVKGGIVLAGAGGVSLILHRASAASRHLVWTAALMCLPVLTLLALSGPAWQWHVLTPVAAVTPPVAEIVESTSSAVPFQLAELNLPIGSTPHQVRSASVPAATAIPWQRWLAAAWMGVAAVTLLPLLVGICAVARIGRTARIPSDNYWTTRLDRARLELRLRRPVKLLEHERYAMPMTWGVLRPRVLLPAEARDWTEEKQRAVLLHELAHVKRLDYLTRMLARIGLALHGFNPLAWVAWRRMHLESERACDDQVLAAGSDPTEYADSLLQIARHCLGARWTASSAITMARKSQLEGRILAVLDASRARAGVGRRRLVLILALVAGLVVPLSAIRLVARESSGTIDLVRAVESKMKEVMTRKSQGHAYKDKTSLDGVWEAYRERARPEKEDIASLMAEVENWAKRVVEKEGADEEEYLWRLTHLLSLMADDAGDVPAARLWLERSLESYPSTHYTLPSKHSKFQHLANELAGLRWSTDGREVAERESLRRFYTDPRYEYFFFPWWEQEALRDEGGEPLDALRQEVLKGYLQRLVVFPERANLTRQYMRQLAERTGPKFVPAEVWSALGTTADAPEPAPTAGTLQSLIDAAAAGDVVEIPRGQYDEPLRIEKAIILRGIERSQSMLKVKADRPAIHVVTNDPVVIENLTIEWQLATSRSPRETRMAVFASDGQLTIRNCAFSGDAGPERCPTAVSVIGFGQATLQGCLFSGFNFTVEFGGGAKGIVEDCMFVNPGHCGITAGNGSDVTVRRTLVTGSAFHGLRCTGGTLNAEDNVIIANKNRGIYLGNRAAHGVVRNNVIHGNATGISVFGGSDTLIRNNVLIDNTFAGIDSRSYCPIHIEGNVLLGNSQGVVVWEEGDRPTAVQLGPNLYWQNRSNDVLRIALPADSVLADPMFADAKNGDFTSTSTGKGLSNPSALLPVWEKWVAIRDMRK